jgi:sugar phosphate isomerase/epimerase
LLEVYHLKDRIKTELDTLNISIPVFCIVLPGLSSPDRITREKNLELFNTGCQVAETIGASAVLDNAPLPPWEFPDDIPFARHYDEESLARASFPKDLSWPKYWDAVSATYREACKIAADYHLTYHMHPCLGVMSATTDAFLQFADSVNMDNLRFNLDTANQYYLKDNLYLSLLRLADRIDYIHISDNRGTKIEHLVPGQGVINWDMFFETLDKINYKGLFGIDVGGAETDIDDLDKAYIESAKWLQKRWFGD